MSERNVVVETPRKSQDEKELESILLPQALFIQVINQDICVKTSAA
jgi:hypothetical protein